jgi:hypothetical protein
MYFLWLAFLSIFPITELLDRAEGELFRGKPKT